MDTMTATERVETVLAGGIPDRVPVDLHDFMVSAHASDMTFPDYFQDGEAMAEGHIAAWREFGHDVLLVESGTASLAQACGSGVEYLDDTVQRSQRAKGNFKPIPEITEGKHVVDAWLKGLNPLLDGWQRTQIIYKFIEAMAPGTKVTSFTHWEQTHLN